LSTFRSFLLSMFAIMWRPSQPSSASERAMPW
jgi:hypothetical protein